MFVRARRCLRDLLSFPLCSLRLSSLALGGLILATPAWAQEEEEVEEPLATIVDVALEDGALTARVLWTAQEDRLSDTLKLVSFNGEDEVTGHTAVTPSPGEVSEVKLFGALVAPWETGWAQKLVLEDSEGTVLAVQPYDVNLDCETDDECALVVSPGIASNAEVIHLSPRLNKALTLVQEKNRGKDFDLVQQVSENFPELRGEALVYADALSKQPVTEYPCNCVWTSSMAANPSGPGSSLNASNATGFVIGWNGPGAKHWMTASSSGSSWNQSISQGTQGASEVGLKVLCSQKIVSQWLEIKARLPDNSERIVPIETFVLRDCNTECKPQFDHMARVMGVATTNMSPGSLGGAAEQALWRVEGFSLPLLDETATQLDSGFNAANFAITFSNTGSTNRVETTGTILIAGSGNASVRNSYSLAMHGISRCSNGLHRNAAVWEYNTTQGLSLAMEMRSELKDFFMQWGLDINP